MKIRAISLDVYSNELFKSCSNGGITERFNSILIEHPRGYINIDTKNPPENFCRVITRKIADYEYKHIEPVASVKPGNVGYMDGGSFAHSSDARFYEISKYPLAIHDRQETQKQYDLMSH
jgi:hypothetical protein